MSKSETGQVHTPLFGKVMLALLHDLTITDGAKVLFAHMHYRYGYGKKEDNHEGQKSMAAALGVTEKTIRNRIDELEANDWIVTIYDEHDKKGNWQRCHYHIFETQDECRKFRASYKPVGKEELKAKPESRERVSRKGKGNAEAVPPPPPRRKPSSIATGGNQVPLVDGNQVPSDGGTQVPNIQNNQSIQNQSIQNGGISDERARLIINSPTHARRFELQAMTSHPIIDGYSEAIGAPYLPTEQDKLAALRAQVLGYTQEDAKALTLSKIGDGKTKYPFSWMLTDLATFRAGQGQPPSVPPVPPKPTIRPEDVVIPEMWQTKKPAAGE